MDPMVIAESTTETDIPISRFSVGHIYVFAGVRSGFGERGADYFDKARCIARGLDMSTMTIISCRSS